MRIALLTNNPFPPREGIGWHVAALAREFRTRGHEVRILARGSDPLRWQRLGFDGVACDRYPFLPLRPFHHSLARPHIAAWLAGEAAGADIVHVHLPLLPPVDVRTSVAVTVHTPMLADNAAIAEPGLAPKLMRLNARLFSRRYEQAWLDRADVLFTVSSRVAAELATHYRLGVREPIVCPNGVDTRAFTFAPLAGREPFLLYVGRLSWRKGVARLLEAFAMLRTSGLRLVIAGEGPLRPGLEARARELGIAGRTEFLGFVGRPALQALLQRARCFVHPSDYEGFPLVLLEAMAAGAPVVTTPIGALADLGRDPPLFLAGPDPRALAAAIDDCLADDAAATVRAACARALVERAFDWRIVASRVLAGYGSLLRHAA